MTRAAEAGVPILNVMSVDVEDYFQVSAFDRIVDRREWGSFESRVTTNTERLLELFDQHDVKATLFILGWVAERAPGLVRRIVASGHELASHGYGHRLTYELTPAQFREDLRRARGILEDVGGVRVSGYRAPSYSIVERSIWALDVLVEEGYEYDASIYPIRHHRYGMPSWERHVHTITRAGGPIWELPGSTIQVLGANLPIGGGGYFRLLPYGWTRRGIAHVNQVEGRPAIFYLHPWEIDAEQPRLPAPATTRFRHYRNLDRTYRPALPSARRLPFWNSDGCFDGLGSLSGYSQQRFRVLRKGRLGASFGRQGCPLSLKAPIKVCTIGY